MSKPLSFTEFIRSRKEMSEAANPYGALEGIRETTEVREWIQDFKRTDRNLYRKIELEKEKLIYGLGDRKFERDGVYAYQYHGRPRAFRLYYGFVGSQAWLLWGDNKPSSRQQTREINKAVELLEGLKA